MRLATYDRDGTWRGAVAFGQVLVDAAGAAKELGVAEPATFATVRALVAQPRDWLHRLEEAAHRILASHPDDVSVITDPVLGPPVPDPQKVLCVGLNYREHAAEAGLDDPKTPVIFAKFPNTLIGAEAIVAPPAAYDTRIDYEGEVAVVIGKPAYGLPVAEALDAVAGWMPFNDITARDVQALTTQWTMGKSPDTFGPCGPYLVLDDAVGDDRFELETVLNGERVQHATSEQMIFSVAELISFVSSILTLVPGDVIATGTPAGVGAHSSPPRFLHDGDVVEVRVNGENLRNPIRARTASAAQAPAAIGSAAAQNG